MHFSDETRFWGCVRRFAHRAGNNSQAPMISTGYNNRQLVRFVLNVGATFWEEG
jgi:hypothetical protein